MGKPHMTASYEERRKELEAFLNARGLSGKAEILPLDDPFGITVTDRCIEALVVSEETEKIAVKINQKRVEARLPPLEIATIGMVPADNCAPISTTRIREGEIDREGHMLKKP
jgi:pantetheine-phosphate adenylyltransferase